MPTLTSINSRRAREKFRDLLDMVYAGDSDVQIERHGKPVAVMIPVEDYRALEDVLEDLRTSRRAEAIYEDWLANRSSSVPYSEVRSILVEKSLLDK